MEGFESIMEKIFKTVKEAQEFDYEVCNDLVKRTNEFSERINKIRKENKGEFYNKECSCSGDCNHE